MPVANEDKWKYLYEPLKSKLKKNSITNIIFFIVTLPILFIITPIILKFVGKEVYGIWVLTGTILVFVELIGGLQSSSALSVIVPKYEPKSQSKEINEIINTFFVFYLTTAVILCVLYFFLEDFLLQTFFNVNQVQKNIARFVLSASFYLFIVNFILAGYAHLLAAFNIIYVHNILHIIIGYIRLGLMVYFLFLGYDIKSVVLIQMITTIFETILIILITKKIFPELSFNPLLFKIEKLKKLLSISIRIFFTGAASLINYNFDKLVLGWLLNPIVVAYYHIGVSITKYIATVPDMLGMPSLLPTAAELKSKGKTEKISLLYNKSSKYILFTGIFLMSGIIIFGKEFLYLWLGSGYEQAYMVMIFLSLGYTYNLLGYAPTFILNGMEKINETMQISLLTAFLNIILSVLFAIKYGLKGALYGTCASMIFGATILIFVFYKITGIMVDLKKILTKPILAVFISFLAVYLINTILITKSTLFLFFSKVILFSVLFLIIIYLLKYFDEYDIELIKGGLKKS